ncbi:MAG: RnfABCDGE type electron transport complex subunit D [Ruminococcus sp.]|nr:RnfABCDGE type electron transport complex subunit D [Ruminococcus sp.]
MALDIKNFLKNKDKNNITAPETAVKSPKTQIRERRIWLDSMITLLALELMACFSYGMRAAMLAGICVAAAAVTELICLRLMRREAAADDLICTSDALMTALMLPAVFDYRAAAAACIFAVVMKNVLGGRRNMIFSPAAAAYTFLYASWKGQLLMFQQPHDVQDLGDIAGNTANLVNSASHTFNMTGKLPYSAFELLMGNFPGPPGAVSILILLIAALMLLLRRDISAGAFTGAVFGFALLSMLVPAADSFTDSLKYTLCTNMTLFASVYIIADRRISPQNPVFAFMYGFLTAAAAYIAVATSAKENAVVMMTMLTAPIALGFRNIERHIASADETAGEEAAGNAE